MAESVHSQITAVSWGFVSFTDNSLFGTSRFGHFLFFLVVCACRRAWHACVWIFLGIVNDLIKKKVGQRWGPQGYNITYTGFCHAYLFNQYNDKS